MISNAALFANARRVDGKAILRLRPRKLILFLLSKIKSFCYKKNLHQITYLSKRYLWTKNEENRFPTLATRCSIPLTRRWGGFRYMKGQGFYSLKYTKGWGNLSLGSVKGPKGLTDEFYGFIKPKKRFYFGNWFLFKRQCISEFLTKYVKGVPFVNRRYTKALPFSWKMVYKRVRGWISKRSLPPPRIWKFVEYPPGLKPFCQRAHFSGWNWTFTAGPQK